MDTFEHQFESLDVQTEFVESAMTNQTALSTPEDDVNLLMQQVAVRSTMHATVYKWLLGWRGDAHSSHTATQAGAVLACSPHSSMI